MNLSNGYLSKKLIEFQFEPDRRATEQKQIFENVHYSMNSLQMGGYLGVSKNGGFPKCKILS